MNAGLLIKLISVVLLIVTLNIPFPGDNLKINANDNEVMVNHQDIEVALATGHKSEVIQELDRQIQLLKELRQEVETSGNVARTTAQ